MEGLLKTWKQPVPESMDPRPVFQPEVTRDIENALIKFQTAAVQAQAQSQRLPHGLPARPMSNSAWRDTPTPPQNMPQYAAPSDPRLRQVCSRPSFDAYPSLTAQLQPYPPTTQYNQYPSNTATPPTQFSASHQFQPPVTSGDLESLKVEVANVIAATKATWASNFGDVNVQTQLKALLDLQRVLIEQPLLPQQLGVIRNQIRALSSPPASASAYPPSVSAPAPNIRTPVQVANPAYPPTSTPMNLAQILASVRPPGPPSFAPSPAPPAPIATPSLADILRSVSTPGPLSATSTSMLPMFPPPFTAAPPPIPTSTPAPTANYSATANLAQLLASINKPPATQHTPVQSTPVPQLFQQPPAATPAPVNTDWLMNALKGIPGLPGVGAPLQSAPAVTAPMARQIPVPTNSRNVIELTTASMKQYVSTRQLEKQY
jgi:pre-mRNA cleavage complex 2 protein Pcf11